jgi:predicted dehydrogenase
MSMLWHVQCNRVQMLNLLFVMDKWRYHPGILELARLAQSGTLGEVQSLSCTRWGWRSRPNDVDAIWHLAPHDLSIILEILGFLLEIRCVRPAYHDGVLSGCVVLLGDQPWVEIRVSERRERHYRETRVHGNAALAVLPDSYSSAIQLVRFSQITGGDPPDVELVPIADDMPLRTELGTFVQYLNGGPAPKSNFADALTIVNALEQIHALAQSE